MPTTTAIIQDLKSLQETALPTASEQLRLPLSLGWRCLESDKHLAAFELFSEAQSEDVLCEQAFLGMSVAMLGAEQPKTARKLLSQALSLHKLAGDGTRTEIYETTLDRIDALAQSMAASPQSAKRENAVLSEQLFLPDLPYTYDHPLILSEPQICVLFSAKCGCTTVAKWALHHLGLLEAAMRYDPWPHAFRSQVLYQSQEYKALKESFKVKDYTYYFVVRNPYRRLLSAYCHFGLRQQLLDQAGFCGDVVSFRKFTTAICRNMDLAFNTHVRPQYTKQRANLDRAVDMKRIRIEDGLVEQLSGIERAHNLPNPMSESLTKSISESSHHATYEASGSITRSEADQEIDFNYHGSFAPPETYFDDELFDLIYECYKSDFIHCGYRMGEL